MEFTLERLIADIRQEKMLWVSEPAEEPEKILATWDKVANKNKLTGTEAKSIFKVLCKKYKQEAGKPTSTWKLFNHLKFLDEDEKSAEKEPTDVTPPPQQPPPIIEEETYVELLEVKDEDFSDDEYSRSFDEVKSELESPDGKTEKQSDSAKSSPEPEKKESVIPEKNNDKIATAPPEMNSDKKPVIQTNLNMKRKLSDPKDEHNLPAEKRPAHVLKLFPSKAVQNGIIKHNVETETEPVNQHPIQKRYFNFGQYVESTLNRLSPRLAAKLEIKILQSIIEVSSEMMDKLE